MTSCAWAASAVEETESPSVAVRATPRPVDRRLEPVDQKLLELLLRDGRASMTFLAQTVGLSVSAVAVRVHRLQAHGVITGFHASVDPLVLGHAVCATVRVRLATTARCAGFEEWLERQVDVADVFHCTGNFDYELRVACRDHQQFNSTMAAIRHDGGAAETEITLLLDRIERSCRTG